MTDLCVKIRLKISIVGMVETERRQRVRFAHVDRPKRESSSFSRFRKRGELYALCAPREPTCPFFHAKSRAQGFRSSLKSFRWSAELNLNRPGPNSQPQKTKVLGEELVSTRLAVEGLVLFFPRSDLLQNATLLHNQGKGG